MSEFLDLKPPQVHLFCPNGPFKPPKIRQNYQFCPMAPKTVAGLDVKFCNKVGRMAGLGKINSMKGS